MLHVTCTTLAGICAVLLSNSVKAESKDVNCSFRFMMEDVVVTCLITSIIEKLDCVWHHWHENSSKGTNWTIVHSADSVKGICDLTIHQPQEGSHKILLNIYSIGGHPFHMLSENVLFTKEPSKKAQTSTISNLQLTDNGQVSVTAGQTKLFQTQPGLDKAIKNVTASSREDSFQKPCLLVTNENTPGALITQWCNFTQTRKLHKNSTIQLYTINQTQMLNLNCNGTYICSASSNFKEELSTQDIEFNLTCNGEYCYGIITNISVLEDENISCVKCQLSLQDPNEFNESKESSTLLTLVTIMATMSSIAILVMLTTAALWRRHNNGQKLFENSFKEHLKSNNIYNNTVDLLSFEAGSKFVIDGNESKPPTPDAVSRILSPDRLVYVSVVIDPHTERPDVHQTKTRSTHTRTNYAEIDFVATARFKEK